MTRKGPLSLQTLLCTLHERERYKKLLLPPPHINNRANEKKKQKKQKRKKKEKHKRIRYPKHERAERAAFCCVGLSFSPIFLT